jgi:hypothetical protein
LRRFNPDREYRQALWGAESAGYALGMHAPHEDRAWAEEDFIARCWETDLPIPLVNFEVGALVVDFAWPRERVVVETEFNRFFWVPDPLDEQQARDRLLRSWDFLVLRYSRDQLEGEPKRVWAEVAAALRSRGTSLAGAEAPAKPF